MDAFLLTFIPLLVAIDPLGSTPFFISLTQGYSPAEKRKLAIQAVITAFVFGLTFSVAGRLIFKAIGITPADFQIAGGLLLLIFSIQEIFGHASNKPTGDTADHFIGVVPIGIPVIAGPALITTLLILQEQHSFLIIVLALTVNMLITLFMYMFSHQIISKLGEATAKVSAKVVAIFLAAIGIMMIRRGLEAIF